MNIIQVFLKVVGVNNLSKNQQHLLINFTNGLIFIQNALFIFIKKQNINKNTKELELNL